MEGEGTGEEGTGKVPLPTERNTDEGLLYSFHCRNPSLFYVKWFWMSCNAFLYCRTLTISRCLTLAKNGSPIKVHTSCMGGFALLGSLDPRFSSPIGRASIFPDWGSIRLIDSTHASVQCRVAEDLVLYQHLAMVSPYQRCPRSCLERVIETAYSKYSFAFLAAFELEFYLVSCKDETFTDFTAKNDRRFPQRTWSSAACARGLQARCVEACMKAMENAGIVVEQGHAESAPGQFEISIAPLTLVAAADALLCSKEIIIEVAKSHGFGAIFIPKPFEDMEPTGLHLHLSIHHIPSRSGSPSTENLTGPETRSEYEISQQHDNQFLAGLLHRLPALLAFSMPSENSYKRLSTDSAMGFHVAWGKQNPSVPISKVSTGYWEVRCLDWTANIYLAIATFLSAGLVGIQESQSLEWRDPETCTYNLGETELNTLGITRKLPKTFAEAFANLIEMRYAGLQYYIGEELLDLYVLVKGSEQQYFSTLTEEQKTLLLRQHI